MIGRFVCHATTPEAHVKTALNFNQLYSQLLLTSLTEQIDFKLQRSLYFRA